MVSILVVNRKYLETKQQTRKSTITKREAIYHKHCNAKPLNTDIISQQA